MNTDSQAPVLTQIRNGVGIAVLNRPDKFNCLSSGIVAGLDGALTAFENDAAVRAVLIHGEGKNFCTGADLDEVLEARKSRPSLETFIANGHRVLERLERTDLPVVAAVHGLCLAGGLELMMACDVVFMSRSAQLGCQHSRYGLVPGWGGTQRLARLVGIRRALDLMYSGRWLKADEARDWGLVNYVGDAAAPLEEAEAYCADLARKSPDGLAAMKRLARRGLDETLPAGLLLEQSEVVDALLSENVSEGLAAFQARRTPVFR
jgi:enoyl-CoA hydratase|tara:strand:+ start:431 stop:1219 length:789 start_codon:yes stop_codon:yes gene_type:complete